MIAVRWTYLPKKIELQEFVDLWKAQVEGKELTTRIYRPNFSPWGQVVVETEFESLAAYAEWFDNLPPEAYVFMEEMNKLRQTGGSGEIWILE